MEQPRVSTAPLALRLTGFGLGSVALGMNAVVVSVILFDRTGSAGWAMVGAGCRFVPFVAFSALSGVLSDRADRHRVLLLAPLAQAATGAVLALSTSAPLAVVALIGFLGHVAWTPAYPTVAAVVPSLVDSEGLAAANALLSATSSISWIIGPGLGGLLVSVSSPRAASTTAAALGLVAVVVSMLARPPAPIEPAVERVRPSVLRDLAAGGRALIRSRAVGPVGVLAMTEAVYGALQVLLLIAATRLLHMSNGGFGALSAALGAGAFAGMLLARQLAPILGRFWVLAAAAVVTGAPVGAVAALHHGTPAVALLIVSGAGLVLTEVLTLTALQRSVNPQYLGRVFGILDTIIVASELIGSLVAAALVHQWGLRTALLVVGTGMPLAALTLVAELASQRRRTEEELSQWASRVALLASLPVLGSASRTAVEALARSSTVLHVEPGTAVVRQGAAPDDFFAIIHGVFDVVIEEPDGSGFVTARLTRGQGFGEIGLLRSIPRTATVVATEPSEILRIPGLGFLQAVGPGKVTGGGALTGAIVDYWTAG